jgi:hypothetical protein
MTMRVLWSVVASALVGGVSSLSWAAENLGLTKAEDAAFANRMVVAALEAEAKGDFAAREKLLADAAEGGASDVAQWHRGLLNVGSKKPEWQSIDESIAAATKDTKLAQYEKVRAQSPDNAVGHLAMAKWCLEHKLEDQARAHLNRVLDFSPDHAAARNALGFVRIGDRWMSPVELDKLEATTTTKTNSVQKHGKTIATLVEKMNAKSPKDRAAATAAFMAIKDPEAVGAVESALATPDRPTSKLLVEWMGEIDCVESSLVLTRYCLLHPEAAIRDQAAEKLVNRPLHDFVPVILKALSAPSSALVIPNFDRQGRLISYQQAFAHENPVPKASQTLESRIQRVVQAQLKRHTSSNNFVSRSAPLLADADAETQARQQAAAETQLQKLDTTRQNELIKELDQRIANVIARVSKMPFTTSAEEMWKWWDDYNEAEMQRFKPDRYRSSYATSTMPQYSRSCECFVAGTPVLTQTGPKRIEQIRAGDLVLSRDLNSGELRWQPVLKATNRPAAPTFNIYVEDETFRCTGGHLFWVSGLGWKKASELEAGHILHAAKSPVRISAVSTEANAPTFNLEVADSPNYFVGRQMILAHDVTPREMNRQQIPGQDYVRQLSEQRPAKKTASR